MKQHTALAYKTYVLGCNKQALGCSTQALGCDTQLWDATHRSWDAKAMHTQGEMSYVFLVLFCFFGSLGRSRGSARGLFRGSSSSCLLAVALLASILLLLSLLFLRFALLASVLLLGFALPCFLFLCRFCLWHTRQKVSAYVMPAIYAWSDLHKYEPSEN